MNPFSLSDISNCIRYDFANSPASVFAMLFPEKFVLVLRYHGEAVNTSAPFSVCTKKVGPANPSFVSIFRIWFMGYIGWQSVASTQLPPRGVRFEVKAVDILSGFLKIDQWANCFSSVGIPKPMRPPLPSFIFVEGHGVWVKQAIIFLIVFMDLYEFVILSHAFKF